MGGRGVSDLSICFLHKILLVLKDGFSDMIYNSILVLLMDLDCSYFDVLITSAHVLPVRESAGSMLLQSQRGERLQSRDGRCSEEQSKSSPRGSEM